MLASLAVCRPDNDNEDKHVPHHRSDENSLNRISYSIPPSQCVLLNQKLFIDAYSFSSQVNVSSHNGINISSVSPKESRSLAFKGVGPKTNSSFT